MRRVCAKISEAEREVALTARPPFLSTACAMMVRRRLKIYSRRSHNAIRDNLIPSTDVWYSTVDPFHEPGSQIHRMVRQWEARPHPSPLPQGEGIAATRMVIR